MPFWGRCTALALSRDKASHWHMRRVGPSGSCRVGFSVNGGIEEALPFAEREITQCSCICRLAQHHCASGHHMMQTRVIGTAQLNSRADSCHKIGQPDSPCTICTTTLQGHPSSPENLKRTPPTAGPRVKQRGAGAHSRMAEEPWACRSSAAHSPVCWIASDGRDCDQGVPHALASAGFRGHIL